MAKKIVLDSEGKAIVVNNNVVFREPTTLKSLLNGTKSARCLLYKYEGSDVDDLIEYDDTENVLDMSNMFGNCEYLITIPQLNTSNVTDMSSMFSECPRLTTIPQLDTSKVINMYGMFESCSRLTTLPQLDTSNVTKMSYMFYECTNLKTIDITSMDKITSDSNSSYMCYECYRLTKLIIRNMTVIPPLGTDAFYNCYHFTGKKFPTYNPSGLRDGRIYVPDNMVDSLKKATNWSAYASIIVPLSSLGG